MQHRSFNFIKPLGLCLALAMPLAAQATPSLQLGITDGTYVGGTVMDTVATSEKFTLNAYLLPDALTPLTDEYYLSFAISPQVSAASDLGSFTINGKEYKVTSDMLYGVPPVDAFDQGSDSGDLATHSVFPTYFNEIKFYFDNPATQQIESQQTAEHNVEYSAGIDPTKHLVAQNGMYFQQFAVDISNLSANYALHFDLYSVSRTCTLADVTEQTCLQWDTDIKKKAPFSHDASSGISDGNPGTGGDPTKVPEPAPLAMLALGLLGLTAARKKRSA